MRRRRVATLILLAGPLSLPLSASTYRVDPSNLNAVDSPACGTEAVPCRSIQQAVNNSVSGDSILVAAGTYTYSAALEPAACNPSTAVVCMVDKSLTVRGGFDGNDWSTPDPGMNVTTVDGQNTVRGVIFKRSTPNAAPVSLTLEGFTVTNGVADRSPADGDTAAGGGIAVLLATAVLRDLIVRDSLARGADTSGIGGIGSGGGIAIRGAISAPVEATLERITLTNNRAVGGTGDTRGGHALGGGILANRATQIIVTDLVLEQNTAEGGASAGPGDSGGIRADALGGGLAMLTTDSATLTRITANDNSALAGSPTGLGAIGGGSFGGGLFFEASAVQLTDSEVRDNESIGGSALNGSPAQPARGGIGAGGGITTFEVDLTLDEVVVRNNVARGGDGPAVEDNGDRGNAGGGGLYLEETVPGASFVSITNLMATDNRVEHGSGDGGSGGGGGIFFLGQNGKVANATIAGNSLNSALLDGVALVSATRQLGQPGESPSNVEIRFSIIADHTSLGIEAVRVNPNSTVDFASEETLFANNPVMTGGPGTVTGDDNLQSAAAAGFVSPGSPDFDYHLASGSPAIGQAIGSSTATDIDAQIRGVDLDLGADEHCSAADDDLALPAQTVSSPVVETACNTITAGAGGFTVAAGGELLLQAGVALCLDNGFDVETGGILTVVNSVP